MSRNGILIDYEFCTGCHTCEMACKTELGLPKGKWGIQVSQIGPWQIDDNQWEYTFIPVPTTLCNLCEDRVAAGKLPTCVHHCQALVMRYGPVEELAALMKDKPKMLLFAPK
ncbi:4Fe-4S ferredoxin iron-sulfur binding domain protein [Desulfitobacterium hafniense DCB-2]|uniref:4Fe-4S ferredoxin iron-sulfur binding domain-containing protein n=2 Tax=Desulfitobacterium hafniense TaxID=49338 RepID=A0A098B485_DESHA|nr:4Fe-4S binding protein [Desulfitobacterium hafniense]ACL19946.1 4Fe-4S ferredoxin iron-sulfur binding domain protein [Desulfitobacterium hafniense DCB-2]CDX03698.1 4Fe-4S ferredoxin iron-sulfur binding domain-containing protein [Desulfitobacterium hafniense]